MNESSSPNPSQIARVRAASERSANARMGDGIAGRSGDAAIDASPSYTDADSDPESLFTFAARRLATMGIAFLELREPGFNGIFGVTDRPPLSPKIRAVYHGPLVLNEEYSRDAAQEAIETGRSEAVSFGRAFISNPDLPHRFAIDASLTADDRSTWYTAGREGYNDYPAFE